MAPVRGFVIGVESLVASWHDGFQQMELDWRAETFSHVKHNPTSDLNGLRDFRCRVDAWKVDLVEAQARLYPRRKISCSLFGCHYPQADIRAWCPKYYLKPYNQRM